VISKAFFRWVIGCLTFRHGPVTSLCLFARERELSRRRLGPLGVLGREMVMVVDEVAFLLDGGRCCLGCAMM